MQKEGKNMWKNILVAFDGSEYAVQALQDACEIAKAAHANLTILAVVKLPEPLLGLKPEVFINDATNYYKQQFADALKNNSHLDKGLTLEVAVGRPSEVLVTYAMQHKVDLIVIGHTKKKALIDKIMLGSVAKDVLEHAACSVLLVR